MKFNNNMSGMPLLSKKYNNIVFFIYQTDIVVLRLLLYFKKEKSEFNMVALISFVQSH